MADASCETKSMRYTCIAFVYKEAVSRISRGEAFSAVLQSSSGEWTFSGTLVLSGRTVTEQSTDHVSLTEAVDIDNGCTVGIPAAKITCTRQACTRQDAGECYVAENSRSLRVRFVMPAKVCLFKLDAHQAGCVTKVLVSSPRFRRHFMNYACHCRRKHTILPVQSGFLNVRILPAIASSSSSRFGSEPDLPGRNLAAEETADCVLFVHQSIVVVMTWPHRLWLDYLWCYRLNDLVVKRMELDDALNWLSTLGGAYSSLGDHFVHHAECAGQMSLKQLRVAMEMGSTPIVIRCHLYFALSLLQTGRLHAARRLIRLKYAEVQQLPVYDSQLVAVCQSLWNRLRYLRQQQGLRCIPARPTAEVML